MIESEYQDWLQGEHNTASDKWNFWKRFGGLQHVLVAVLMSSLGLLVVESHEGYTFGSWEMQTASLVALIAGIGTFLISSRTQAAINKIDELEDEIRKGAN
jgi:ABC-type uncharacterized transport system permease subunit